MTAIHVSRAQVDALRAGCPVIVVEGEPCRSPTSCPPMTRQMCRHGGIHPPTDLVAATEATCQTCDGEGLLGLEDYPARPIEDCPDCIDGRPWVDLVVDCETCGGQHSAQSHMPGYWRNGRIVNVAGGCAFVTVTCPDCTDGQRTVARVQISEVVRIVGANDEESESAKQSHIVVWSGDVDLMTYRAELEPGGYYYPFTSTPLTGWLPAIAPDGPESIVGRWAAIVTAVEAL